MITTSLKDTEIARQMPPKWIFTPKFENYLTVLVGGEGYSQGFDRLMLNSIIVTVTSTVLCLIVAFPAALALSQPKFRKRKFLSSWILSTYMFPPIVAIIPIFIFAGKIQALDTYPVLAIPYAAFNLPIVIWILKSSIEQIPKEIEEAARVDGANGWHYVSKILLPLAVPALATGAILSSILSWNDFLFAIFLTGGSPKLSVATTALNFITGSGNQVYYGNNMTASLIVSIPTLLVYLFLGRYFLRGMLAGSLKG